MADYIYSLLQIRNPGNPTPAQTEILKQVTVVDGLFEEFDRGLDEQWLISDSPQNISLSGELRWGTLEDNVDDALVEASLEFNFIVDPIYEFGGSWLEVRFTAGEEQRRVREYGNEEIVASENLWKQAKESTVGPVAFMEDYFNDWPWADETPK